jgi:hypothetical protein
MFAMPDRREQAALITLLRRGDRPWHPYAQLAEGAGSALAILEGRYADPYEDEPLQLFLDDQDDETIDLEAVAREIDAWGAEGMAFVTVLDDEYPVNLRSVHNRPPFLFVRGELQSEDERSIAVVGTRSASEPGLHAAGELTGALVEAGYTIVSGLAMGIDGRAGDSRDRSLGEERRENAGAFRPRARASRVLGRVNSAAPLGARVRGTTGDNGRPLGDGRRGAGGAPHLAQASPHGVSGPRRRR